jgi:RNA polymerase primary sigma factor
MPAPISPRRKSTTGKRKTKPKFEKARTEPTDPNASPDGDAPVFDAANELPPHLARLVATPLLSASRERELFRRMGSLNQQASQRLSSVEGKVSEKRAARARAEADQLLAESREIRDEIVQANVRLVMWVVKRFATPRRPFDELLSDGLLTLMKAVQKFDCERGVRFSTYACRALISNTCRSISSETKRQQKFGPWSEIAGETALAREELSELAVGADGLRHVFAQMVDRLDEREKLIICGRFAVGSVDRVITRESLANDLGVSKERVRQLQQRALQKLQAIAVEMKLDALL